MVDYYKTPYRIDLRIVVLAYEHMFILEMRCGSKSKLMMVMTIYWHKLVYD